MIFKLWSGFIVSAALVVISLHTAVAQTLAPGAIPAGRIIDTALRSEISPEQLVKALQSVSIVIIGERHDQIAHHQIQSWLVRQVQPETLAMEMLDTSQNQAVTDVQKWVRAGGSTSSKRLADKLTWNMAWGWHLYSALMEDILPLSTQIVAANPTRAQVRSATNFSPSGKAASNAIVQDALKKLMHTHHGDPTSMVAMQQFKDNNMAQVLLDSQNSQTNPNHRSWLIAGSIHASKQLGVPLFLQDANWHKSTKVLIISDQELDQQHADYIWLVSSSE